MFFIFCIFFLFSNYFTSIKYIFLSTTFIKSIVTYPFTNYIFSVFNSCEIDEDVDYSLLFDRFYRPDSSRPSSTGGHGIGLSIAKRIVTLHSGTIEAQPSDTGLSINVRLSNKLKPIKQKKVI